MISKKLLLALSISVLTACGGNSSSSTSTDTGASTVTLTGNAADGYLRNANVCLDINGNALCDAGEPSTTTGAGGSYTLNVTEAQKAAYPVIVEAIKDQTIDEDNPDTTISQSYTLAAPAGQSFVSPMSLLVYNAMRTNAALSVDEAANQVRIAMQLPDGTDLLADYVAGEQTDIHTLAQSITVVLANALAQAQTNAGESGLSEEQYGPVLNSILNKIGEQSSNIVGANDPTTITIISANDDISALVSDGETISETVNASDALNSGLYSFWTEDMYSYPTITYNLMRSVFKTDAQGGYSYITHKRNGSLWEVSDSYFSLVWNGTSWIITDGAQQCTVTADATDSSALSYQCPDYKGIIKLSQSSLAGRLIRDILTPLVEADLPEAISGSTATFSKNAYTYQSVFTFTEDQLTSWDCEPTSADQAVADINCNPAISDATFSDLGSRNMQFWLEYLTDDGEERDGMVYLGGNPADDASGPIMAISDATNADTDTQVAIWQKMTVNGQVILRLTHAGFDYPDYFALVEYNGDLMMVEYTPAGTATAWDGDLNQAAANEVDAILGNTFPLTVTQ